MGKSTHKDAKSKHQDLRFLVWAYIILIVLEGALRKWVLPSLSDALLLIRDPIVFLAYFLAITTDRFPKNSFVISLGVLCLLAALTATLFGHANPYVTLYGIRVNALHFPFAFIIGSALNRIDVIKIGYWWLACTIPMTLIICIQFNSPQSAWINWSVGGWYGGGFSGALGRYRPPGTFSFINGVALFYTYSTAFLVAGLTQHNRYPKWLLLLSAVAIIVAVPISISRSLLLLCGFTAVVGLLVSGLKKNFFIHYLKLAILIFASFMIAKQIPIIDDATDAFMYRWESSTGKESGGIKDAVGMRILGIFTRPLLAIEDTPIWGYGIGAGSQVGAKLLQGERSFALGESEWERVLGECGVMVGLGFIFWRVVLALKLFKISLRLSLQGYGLPMILFAASIFNILVGQLGQTTSLGFTVMGIGLIIASLKASKQVKIETEDDRPKEAAS